MAHESAIPAAFTEAVEAIYGDAADPREMWALAKALDSSEVHIDSAAKAQRRKHAATAAGLLAGAAVEGLAAKDTLRPLRVALKEVKPTVAVARTVSEKAKALRPLGPSVAQRRLGEGTKTALQAANFGVGLAAAKQLLTPAKKKVSKASRGENASLTAAAGGTGVAVGGNVRALRQVKRAHGMLNQSRGHLLQMHQGGTTTDAAFHRIAMEELHRDTLGAAAKAKRALAVRNVGAATALAGLGAAGVAAARHRRAPVAKAVKLKPLNPGTAPRIGGLRARREFTLKPAKASHMPVAKALRPIRDTLDVAAGLRSATENAGATRSALRSHGVDRMKEGVRFGAQPRHGAARQGAHRAESRTRVLHPLAAAAGIGSAGSLAAEHHKQLQQRGQKAVKRVRRELGKSFTAAVAISKVDTDQHLVFGWASLSEMNGQPVVDLQGDYIPIEEIEKAAYDYVLDCRVGGDMHDRIAKGATTPKHTADLVESMVFTPEKYEALGMDPAGKPMGWFLGFKVNDEEQWGLVKSDQRTGFSVHGAGRREPLAKADRRHAVEDTAGVAVGAGAGQGAYQEAGYATKHHVDRQTRKEHGRVSPAQVNRQDKTLRPLKSKYGMHLPNGHPGRDNVGYHRAYPKSLPYGRVIRTLGHTHEGTSGNLIGAAATLAGAGLGVEAARHHQKVTKALDLRGRVTKSDAGQDASVAGVAAAGMAAAPRTVRAIRSARGARAGASMDSAGARGAIRYWTTSPEAVRHARQGRIGSPVATEGAAHGAMLRRLARDHSATSPDLFRRQFHTSAPKVGDTMHFDELTSWSPSREAAERFEQKSNRALHKLPASAQHGPLRPSYPKGSTGYLFHAPAGGHSLDISAASTHPNTPEHLMGGTFKIARIADGVHHLVPLGKSANLRRRTQQAVHPPAVKLHPVTSSAIAELGYQPQTRRLAVKFKHGKTYTYRANRKTAAEVLDAKSPGRAYNDHLKGRPNRKERVNPADRARLFLNPVSKALAAQALDTTADVLGAAARLNTAKPTQPPKPQPTPAARALRKPKPLGVKPLNKVPS